MPLKRNTFEGGTNGTTINPGNSGGASGDAFAGVSRTGSAILQFSTDHPTKGVMGCKFTAAVGETALVEYDGFNSLNIRAQYDCLRLASWATSADAGILDVRDAGSSRCSAVLKTTGLLSIFDDVGSFLMQTATPLPADLSNILIDFRMEIGTTTSNGKVWLAWGPAGGPATESISSTTANLGTAAATKVRGLKTNSGGAITGAYADNFTVDDGSGAFLTPAVNIAPTANAGTDQTIDAAATLVLAGSGSDTDGTIASQVWAQVSGPTVTITTPTAMTAGVTAIPAGHYVFGLTVTDDGGTPSTQDTVAVFVRTTTARPDSLVSNPGGFTIGGGAATIPAALADESDSTYAETPDNPAGAVVEVGVQPLQDGQITIPYRVAVTATTPVRTCLTELRSGGTVIASDTRSTTDATTPLTTTPQTYTLTLDPTQLSALAAITNGRNDLRLRHTCS